MELFIRGNSSHSLKCDENSTIADVKADIASLEGLDITELRLCCEGRSVLDHCRVSDFKHSVIDINVNLKGGKVHGSLARAGKVRALTPKVEKQDKKKKKNGRAGKRKLYNRRFRTRVLDPLGRQRGPNSNKK